MNKLYIGLMSGTSLDGIDASLIRTDGQNIVIPIENLYIPYKESFKTKIKKLFDLETNSNFLQIEKKLTDLHTKASFALLEKAQYKAVDIEAIGFHGQTIYHNPTQKILWQIGNPFILAADSGIKTIYDFRRRDIAYGGQGAPLLPIFHKAIMNDEPHPVIVINIGGVANLTYIDNQELIAFDSGPGNALIDDACLKYFGQIYDKNGEISAAGKINFEFVNNILNHDYFQKSHPKSLDRNEFKFIDAQLNLPNKNDVIATLTYFTASSIMLAIKQLPKIPKKIYVCGGGVHNLHLLKLLKDFVKNEYKCELLNINQKHNFDPNFIESQGFAYLAARCCNNLPSAFPSTTGAKKPNICGTIVEI